MKIDPNAPALPCLCQPDGNGNPHGAQVGSATFWETGLTIRAHFAAMAMQGLLSNPLLENAIDGPKCVYATIAGDALKHADALIAELNK